MENLLTPLPYVCNSFEEEDLLRKKIIGRNLSGSSGDVDYGLNASDHVFHEMRIGQGDFYGVIRTSVRASSAPPAFLRDDRMTILEMDCVNETVLDAGSTPGALVGHGDFDAGHPFDFRTNLRIKVDDPLPETTTAAAVTDRHQFFP